MLDGPGHFRVRPDLLEELCFRQAMLESLPRTPSTYKHWLRLCGFTEEEYPYHEIMDFTHEGYLPSGRTVLHTAVLIGETHRRHLITDENHWSARCEGAGLFSFVMLRAVAFAAWHGVSQKDAWDCLHVAHGEPPNPGPSRRMPRWSIGYDPKNSLCTILAREHPGTEALYLAGKPGYHVPILKK